MSISVIYIQTKSFSQIGLERNSTPACHFTGIVIIRPWPSNKFGQLHVGDIHVKEKDGLLIDC